MQPCPQYKQIDPCPKDNVGVAWHITEYNK